MEISPSSRVLSFVLTIRGGQTVLDVDAELEAFGEMEIKDGTKEEEAVAAFRKGLGVSNVEVDEEELEEVS
jgi:hypothetical protein